MRDWWIRGLAGGLLAAVVAAPVVAADDAPSSGWWGWFAGRKQPDKPLTPDGSDLAGPSIDMRREAERAKQENAYWRRQEACDRLMELAVQSGNAELQERIEKLDERNRALYVRRTSNVPTADEGASARPKAGGRASEKGEKR